MGHDRMPGPLVSPEHIRRSWEPDAWGVIHCEPVFEPGSLRIQKLNAVMPDGSRVTQADGEQLTLDLRRKDPTVSHLVYVTMTRRSSRFIEVGEGEILRDNGFELSRVRVRLSLVTEPPKSQDTSFPLLRVSVRRLAGLDRRDHDWSETRDFVPPMLRVPSDSLLGTKCGLIADRLRLQVDALRTRANASPPTSASLEARAQLVPLVSALARFEALLLGQPHPFALYVELCGLAGAVAFLRGHAAPPSVSYNHNDAWHSFDQVARSFAPAAPSLLKFAFEPERQFFRLSPDPGWTEVASSGSSAQWILAVQSGASEERARLWGENCVIGSRGRMTWLESRRVLGPARTFMTQVDGIPSDRRTVLFSVTPDANSTTPGEDLLVLGGTPDVTPTALYLYVLPADGESGNA